MLGTALLLHWETTVELSLPLCLELEVMVYFLACAQRSGGCGAETGSCWMPVPTALCSGDPFVKEQMRHTARIVSCAEILHLTNYVQRYQAHVSGCPCVCSMLLRGRHPLEWLG